MVFLFSFDTKDQGERVVRDLLDWSGKSPSAVTLRHNVEEDGWEVLVDHDDDFACAAFAVGYAHALGLYDSPKRTKPERRYRKVVVTNVPVRACVDAVVEVPEDTKDEDLGDAIRDALREARYVSYDVARVASEGVMLELDESVLVSGADGRCLWEFTLDEAEANVFSYRAARDTEIVCQARRELAAFYLKRIEGERS